MANLARKPLVVPGITVTDPDALWAWIDSRDHVDYCTASSEGQWCCLDYMLGSRHDDDDRGETEEDAAALREARAERHRQVAPDCNCVTCQRHRAT